MARYKDIELLDCIILSEKSDEFCEGVIFAMEEVDKLPTADVVEVVRCEKCKYRITHTCAITGEKTMFCDYGANPEVVQPTHYCGYGEPKGKPTKIEHNSLCETETYVGRSDT